MYKNCISTRKCFDSIHYDLVMVVVICLEAIERLAKCSADCLHNNFYLSGLYRDYLKSIRFLESIRTKFVL